MRSTQNISVDRRVFVRSAAVFGTAAIVSPVFLSACATSGSPGETDSKKAGGTLRIGTVGGFGSIDPALWTSGADTFVMASVMEGLVGREPNSLSSMDLLASSLEVSDDGLTVTFELKPDIQFHQGYGEVTAEDVKASIERTGGLTKTESYYAGDWTNLESVEVTGKYTGTIKFKKPFAPLTISTLPLTSGLITSKAALEQLGDKKFGQNPVGTGPFEFASAVPGQQVVLKRFKEYSGANAEAGIDPVYDQIEFVSFKDPTALGLALQSGDVDFGGPIDLAEVAKFNGEQKVYSFTGAGIGWVGLNMRSPNLQDENVRQAIRYAVDPTAIIDGFYEGEWPRAYSTLPPEVLGHWADAPQYERDVAKAQDYMGQASTAPTELKLTCAVENQTAAQIVQASLKEIGIDVKLDIVDRGSFYGAAAQEEWDIFYHSWELQPDPDWFLQWFTTDQLEGGYNLMGYSDDEYDRLRAEGVETQDADERADIYIRMQELLDEAVCAVWVGYTVTPYAADSSLTIAVSPDGQTQQMWAFQP